MNNNGQLLDFKNNKLSGIKKLSYYDEIPRTSDLLKSAEFSFNNSTNLLISNFFIAPSSIRLDEMVEESIFELNTLLTKKMKLPSENDLRDNSVQENIDKYHSAEKLNVFHDFIRSEGHTGVLSKVASSINNSTIDQLSRAILSEEGVFFYLACRAVKGYKILDADGIGANIFESLNIVKSFINAQLVDKVIRKENLNVSDNDRNKLKKAIAEKRLSYFPGNPVKTIVKLVNELKSGGSLFELVLNFLNSGKVNLDRNTNKMVLAQRMVDYLLKLGFNEDYQDNQNQPHNHQEPIQEVKDADEFEAIEGVGKVTKKEFIDAGIMSFSQLASFDSDSLKKKLKNPKIHIKYDEIIEQAKLISQGKFKDLLKYQDELNKRK